MNLTRIVEYAKIDKNKIKSHLIPSETNTAVHDKNVYWQ